MESYVGGHFGCLFKHFPILIDLMPFLYGNVIVSFSKTCTRSSECHPVKDTSSWLTGNTNWERLPFWFKDQISVHFLSTLIKNKWVLKLRSRFSAETQRFFVSGQDLDDIISSERISVIWHLCTAVFSHGFQRHLFMMLLWLQRFH